MVVAVPLTKRDRQIPLRVRIDPPEGGVREVSFAMCDMVRSMSTERLEMQWGKVSAQTLGLVEDRLRILLEL